MLPGPRGATGNAVRLAYQEAMSPEVGMARYSRRTPVLGRVLTRRVATLAGLLGLLASACGTWTTNIDDSEEDWEKGAPEVVVYFVRVHESGIWVEPEIQLLTEDSVTASAAAPERGMWEHTLTIPGPGTYTIEVEENGPAAGESRLPFVSSRTFKAAADQPDHSLRRCNGAAEPATGGNQTDDPSDGIPGRR
jgi:hypothetical protein